ncbi:hypothetical protein TcWFU_000721 [Taenia crassiceps]|uniref:NFU1 iron-sulfur cluster scaffold homolog, mitochondrial n=1 Tax=Taenia crassiceps TaxID=6207 RepID=A0ABR4Q974_9CEST
MFNLSKNISRIPRSLPTYQALRCLFIQWSETPNPNSRKFVPGTSVLGTGTMDFQTRASTVNSPLARNLFQIVGVAGVFLGPDFVTVTKTADSDWTVINPDIFACLMDFFTTGTPVVKDVCEEDVREEEDEDTTVSMIKELLDSRIRPTVQEDGGDITFVDFKEGVVYLKMQGSCTSCPSSTVTLKHGVQNMLQFYIPEVEAVEEVEDSVSQEAFNKTEAAISAAKEAQEEQSTPASETPAHQE